MRFDQSLAGMRISTRFWGSVQTAFSLGASLLLGFPALAQGKVSVGAYFTCAVAADGTVKCWGYGGNGELGDGAGVNRSSPVTVSGITNAVSVAVSTYHACAVLATGEGRCWGQNNYGQLGNGQTILRQLTPVTVTGISSIARISLGLHHTCALTEAGGVWCWGYGGNGQLGRNSTGDSAVPVSVSGLESGVIDVSAADQHACAVTTSGEARCWGANSSGQLGDGSTTRSLVPVAVAGLGETALRVMASREHSCALLSGRTVRCWGENFDGRLGNGTIASSLAPVLVSTLTNVRQASAGLWHGCAVTQTQALYCWGSNANNWLGLGSSVTRSSVPLEVTTGTTPVFVSTHGSHSCLVNAEGQVWCWGLNNSGQLGIGSLVDATAPVRVPDLLVSTASASEERPADRHLAVRSIGRQGVEVQTTRPAHVVVDVFDVAGRRVARLHDGPLSDRLLVKWPSGLAAGAYVVRATSEGAQASVVVRG